MACKLLICLLFLCSAAHAQVRVASLNLDKHYGPEMIRRIAQNADLRKADILLLQEAVDGPSSHVSLEAAAALGLHAVFAPAFQLNQHFQEGLAILSRYPLSEQAVVSLSHNSLHFHTRIRIALVAMVALPDGPMRVVNVHLDNRVNAKEKREQLEEIWPAAGLRNERCLIGGDFNSANFRWVSHILPIPGIQSLQALVDSRMEEHGFRTPLGSGPGTLHFLGLKLDWIYLRKLTATGFGVTRTDFSDHNSVWVTFLAP